MTVKCTMRDRLIYVALTQFLEAKLSKNIYLTGLIDARKISSSNVS